MPKRRAVSRKANRKTPKRGPPFEATLVFTLGGKRAGASRLRAVERALRPEAGRDLPGASVEVRLAQDTGSLELRIEAESLAALRAASNSYLRWAALALDVASAASAAGEEE